MKAKSKAAIRQGDVLLLPVDSMPDDVKEVQVEANRIVLAYGEVTGHAHAIYDHVSQEKRAGEISDAAISRMIASPKAKLFQAANGDRYLQVSETVTLRHEEHTAHILPPSIYKLPVQVEYAPAELRRVAD